MFESQSFGRYIPGDSFLHRLDARAKFLALIAFILGLIVCQTPAMLLGLLGLVLLLAIIAGLGLNDILQALRPVYRLLLFAFLLNLFMPSGPPYLFSWWIFRVSWESIRVATFMSLRVAGLVLVSNLLLSLVTTAMALTSGLESLMAPLARFGVPVQDIAMMMSIALRFVPTLMEESAKIMKAQSSRGANYDTGGFWRRVQGLVSVLVPLFISAFRRAEDLTVAMEARCYRPGTKRSKLYPPVFRWQDGVFLLVVVLLIALAIFLDRRLLEMYASEGTLRSLLYLC